MAFRGKHMGGVKPCSDTVVLPESFGKQKQSQRGNPPAFSFGAGGDKSNRWNAGNLKASLTHAEVMRMPVTMFQPHLVSV